MPDLVTGVSNVLRAIGRAKTKDAQAVDVALQKYGQVILNKCQKYCPKDTGALLASHTITVTGKGMATRVEISAGGPTAPYALFVHENLEKHHAPPTCAQWITRSVRETRGTGANLVKREIEAKPAKYVTVTGGGEVL